MIQKSGRGMQAMGMGEEEELGHAAWALPCRVLRVQ